MLTRQQKSHFKETVNDLVGDILNKYRKLAKEESESPQKDHELDQKALDALKKINQHFEEPEVYPFKVDSLPQHDPERQLIELYNDPLKSPLLPPEWLEGLSEAQQRELAGAIIDGIELMLGARLEVLQESVQALKNSASASSSVQPAQPAKPANVISTASVVSAAPSSSSTTQSMPPAVPAVKKPVAKKPSSDFTRLVSDDESDEPAPPQQDKKLVHDRDEVRSPRGDQKRSAIESPVMFSPEERVLLAKLEEFATLEFLSDPDSTTRTKLFSDIVNGINTISQHQNERQGHFVQFVEEIIGGDRNTPLGGRVGFRIGSAGGAGELHEKILQAATQGPSLNVERVYRHRAGAWQPVIVVAPANATTSSTSSASTSPRAAEGVFHFSPKENDFLLQLKTLENNKDPEKTYSLVLGIGKTLTDLAKSGQHGQFLKMIGEVTGGGLADAALRRRFQELLLEGRAGELHKKMMDYTKMIVRMSASSEESSKPIKPSRFGNIPPPPPGYAGVATSVASEASKLHAATASTHSSSPSSPPPLAAIPQGVAAAMKSRIANPAGAASMSSQSSSSSDNDSDEEQGPLPPSPGQGQAR